MIANFKKQRRDHAPIHSNGTAEERVSSFKFLGVHITKDRKWTVKTVKTTTLVKRAQQCFYFLRRLKTCHMLRRSSVITTIERILAGCITVWCENFSIHDRKALQWVVKTVH